MALDTIEKLYPYIFTIHSILHTSYKSKSLASEFKEIFYITHIIESNDVDSLDDELTVKWYRYIISK